MTTPGHLRCHESLGNRVWPSRQYPSSEDHDHVVESRPCQNRLEHSDPREEGRKGLVHHQAFLPGGGYAKEDHVAKIGTKKHPAVVRVQSVEQARETLDYCKEHSVEVIVGVEPNKEEDLTDIARALDAPEPALAARPTVEKIGRDDPCPCGSGLKYKKCCLDRAASTG